MPFDILYKPQVLGTALLVMVVLQILSVIILVNILSRLSQGDGAATRSEKGKNVDDTLRMVNSRLKDAEKRQEVIRRNFDEAKERDRRQDQPPYRQDSRRGQFDRHSQRRDRKRPRNRPQDRPQDRRHNRPPQSRQQDEPPARPDRPSDNSPAAAPAPKAAEAPPREPVQAQNGSAEIIHGRRPVIKRRTLGSSPEGAEEVQEQAQPEARNEAVQEDAAKQAE